MARSFDLSDVPSRTPLEAGTYEFVIAKIVEEQTKDKTKEKITVHLKEISSGTYVFDTITLEQSTQWKLKALFDALGFDTSAPIDVDWEELVGLTVMAKIITDDSYDGTPRNRVKSYVA